MLPEIASEIYARFIESVARNESAYSVQCHNEPVVVTGEGVAAFALWPDKESANFYISRHWPELERVRFTSRNLMVRLPILDAIGVPVGIGWAPYHDAILVPAMLLFEDLVRAGI